MDLPDKYGRFDFLVGRNSCPSHGRKLGSAPRARSIELLERVHGVGRSAYSSIKLLIKELASGSWAWSGVLMVRYRYYSEFNRAGNRPDTTGSSRSEMRMASPDV